MNVPLLVDVNNESLTIVHNSTAVEVPLPFRPHMYVPARADTRDTIRRKRIGDNRTALLEKVEYDTVDEYEKAYIALDAHKIRYAEQVYTESPDYFLSYPNTDPLRILVLDIEVYTDGSGIFPRAVTNPITAIGMKIVGDSTSHIYAMTRDELSAPLPDQRIIVEFLEDLMELDPDIIATYNGVKFDMPYLLERMGIVSIDQCLLSRNGEVPTDADIPHRIHWDMWRDVDDDQTLLGLPNRRLKTVANHFGWSDIIDLGREALSNTSVLVGTNELVEYLTSDVHLTEELTAVYIDNHIALAEMVGIPLRETIHAYKSLIPKVVHIRELKDTYIGLQTNEQKYMTALGTMRYEAARVAGYRNGEEVDEISTYYPHVCKVDFSSQYPSAIITFNLGPDTTRIIEYRKYEGKYEFHNDGTHLWLNLPDRNVGKQIIIQVDLRKDGFLRRNLRDIGDKRALVKERLKEDENNKHLHSMQWAYKVEANTVYGYNGLATSKWGDLATAMATVGLCRWLMIQAEGWLGTLKVETDSVTSSTPICILRNEKYIDFIPISELVPDHIIEKRNTRYSHVPRSIQVLTRNGWHHISYVKQHQTQKDIYRINTTDGYVEVTSDHSLFTKDHVEIKPTELSPGSEVELTPIQGIAYDVDYSKDFAWILGFILAEGTVAVENRDNGSRYRYELVINNQDLALLERCAAILERHYMVTCKIYDTRRSSSVYKLIKNDKHMILDLYHLCYTQRGQKKVPLFVLNGTEYIKDAFLSGIWDGDGHVSITRKQHVESIDTIHPTLAAGIRYLINASGGRTGILIRSDKLNVLTIKKRMPRTHHVMVNDNKVKKVELLSSNTSNWVYDVSTEDGTFVAGIGGITLHNTDGAYTSGPVDIGKLNAHLSTLIEDTFHVDSHMAIELEEFREGYFYKTKNYVLRELDGRITRHGTAFKSSRHSRVYELALDKLCLAILDQVEDIWPIIQEIKDWRQYSIADFIHHTSFNQEPDAYANPNAVHPRLARYAAKELGTEIHAGDSIDYIVTMGRKYTIASRVSSLAQVDKSYYEDDVNKILRIFKLGTTGRKGEFVVDAQQPSLF